MGAYTWTFVRIDKVNKEQVKSLVEHAIWSGQHTTYGEYSKLTEEEYNEVIQYALELGVKNAFIQEEETALESFIPPFDKSIV